MKSFLISLGGDKAGRVVDLFTYYSLPPEDTDSGSIEIEVSDFDGKAVSATVELDSKKFKIENGYSIIELDSDYNRILVSSPGYTSVEEKFKFEKYKNYSVKAILGKARTLEGIIVLLLSMAAPLLWAALKYSDVLPSTSQNYLLAAVMLSIVEFIGAIAGLFLLAPLLEKQPKISHFKSVTKGVSIIIGSYFAMAILTLVKLGNIIMPLDIVVISILIIVLASIGIIVEEKGIIYVNSRNTKILNTQFVTGLGAFLGALAAYYLLSTYTTLLDNLAFTKDVLVVIPIVIAVFSVFWGYIFTVALKAESKDTLSGLISLTGIMLISSVVALMLQAPDVLLPLVGMTTFGGFIGFILSLRISREQKSQITIVAEKMVYGIEKKYTYSIDSLAIDAVETRLERLKFISKLGRIYIPLGENLSKDDIIEMEKKLIYTRIKRILEKAMEECSRFYDNFVLFVDLRNSDLCESVPEVAMMLRQEFSLPVYVFVITTEGKVNYSWLKKVAERCDALFPVDYNNFEDNFVVDTISYVEKGKVIREEIVEEGCVGEIIRRFAPILEIGYRHSPSGVDVAHVFRTLKKESFKVLSDCGEISDPDIFQNNQYNFCTIGYFKINAEKCEELNFEADFGKYLAFALKNVLWKFDVNNENERAMVILRGRKEFLRTHMAKSWFDKIFKGITITVSDLLDDSSPYLEIVILISHIKMELPEKNEIKGCSEEQLVVIPEPSPEPQPEPEPEPAPQPEPSPIEPKPSPEPSPPTVKPIPGMDDGSDRVSSRGFPYHVFADIVRDHYGTPILRQIAVKIAQKYPGYQNWEQAKAIYEWVRDNINYVCDPAGKEYIQYPEETIEFKGGDCDDQAVLLASLLLTVGFRSSLVFVPGHVYVAAYLPNAPEEYRTYSSSPKEDGTDWRDWIGMDPTCTNCEFGQLPDEDYNIQHVEDIVRGEGI